eukprot:gene6435-13006_t
MDKLIRSYLVEIDGEKSKEIAKSILQDLGLSGENTVCKIGERENPSEVGNTLEKLSLLAYSGSNKTHLIFAEALRNAVTRDVNTLHPKNSRFSENEVEITKENRGILFNDPVGRKLLSSLLLGNSESGKIDRDKRSELSLLTEKALESLSQDILELIENAWNVPLSETIITNWVSLTLFQRTSKSSDETKEHILHTIQTDHPYKFDPKKYNRTSLYIPGASQISIKFDKKSVTEKEDSLTFYNDEEFNQTKTVSYSGKTFTDIINITNKNSIHFEFKITSPSFSKEDLYGWRFNVCATFSKIQVDSKIQDDNYIGDLQFEIVASTRGIGLIRSYLNSSSDITSRFSALALANLTMSPKCKGLISKNLGIKFFLSLPKDPISMRTTTICIDELLEDEKNRVSALSDSVTGPLLLTELTSMSRNDDENCRFHAIRCLAHLASETEYILMQLKYKCLETLVDATHSSDRDASKEAWKGLKHFATDKSRLLAYGLGTDGEMPKYIGPELEYDMFLSETNKLDLPSLKINVPIYETGFRRINTFYSNKGLSDNIINKVYIEIKITKGVKGRIGIVPAQDKWTCLKTHSVMIGDDVLSWGIDGQRNKVFNGKKHMKPSNGMKIPKPFWKEGSTIGLLVNPIDKVLEISMDGGVSFFPFSLSTTTDENDTESSLDWSTGVVFAATCLSGQGLSFNVGQDPLTCPPGSLSLLDYALLNRKEFPVRPLIFNRALARFVDIPGDICVDLYSDYVDSNKDKNITTTDSDEVISLRNVIRLLFVSSLSYMNSVIERDGNIFTKCTIEESSHPIGMVSSSYERSFRWPGSSLLVVEFEKVNLGKSNTNCLLFKFKGIDGTVRERKVTDQIMFKSKPRLFLNCGVENVRFSVCLEPGDIDGWGYRFKIYPKFADDGFVEEDLGISSKESERPYKSNTSVVEPLVLQGAEAILITFDKDSKIQDCDFVQFYSGSNMNNPIGKGNFSGTNFPGVGDIPPLVIIGSEFTYQWISAEDSAGDVGWRFTYIAVPHPFSSLCQSQNAKVVESSHPCPLGYGSIEVDNTQCPSDVFCLHFHEASDLDVQNGTKNDDNVQDYGKKKKKLEQSWLEVYVMEDDVDVYDDISSHGRMQQIGILGSRIGDVDPRLKRVGERYIGSNLPGIGNTDDLLIPSKRFWIKYYIADNRPTAGMSRPPSSSQAPRLPYGFRAVVFPSEALPESWTVSYEHGNNGSLRIGHNSDNNVISSLTAILNKILPLLSSTDTLTKEYCGGILCNVSYSSSANTLLNDSKIRRIVIEALEEMLKSERSWPRVMAATIISNLATLVTTTTAEVSIDQLVLESGLMGRLLSMWCHSDAITRTRTAENVSRVLSAISRTNSLSDSASSAGGDAIVIALFAMLERGINVKEEIENRKMVVSPATTSHYGESIGEAPQNEIVQSIGALTAGQDITDIGQFQLLKSQNERLMRVIARSLKTMTDLDESTSSGLSMSPIYLKDFLRFLKIPFVK